jgi:hypothetical protein
MVRMRNDGEYTTRPPRFEMAQKGYPLGGRRGQAGCGAGFLRRFGAGIGVGS